MMKIWIRIYLRINPVIRIIVTFWSMNPDQQSGLRIDPGLTARRWFKHPIDINSVNIVITIISRQGVRQYCPRGRYSAGFIKQYYLICLLKETSQKKVFIIITKCVFTKVGSYLVVLISGSRSIC